MNSGRPVKCLRSRLNSDGMRLVDAKVSSLQVSPTRCKFAPPAYHARLPHRTAPPGGPKVTVAAAC